MANNFYGRSPPDTESVLTLIMVLPIAVLNASLEFIGIAIGVLAISMEAQPAGRLKN